MQKVHALVLGVAFHCCSSCGSMLLFVVGKGKEDAAAVAPAPAPAPAAPAAAAGAVASLRTPSGSLRDAVARRASSLTQQHFQPGSQAANLETEGLQQLRQLSEQLCKDDTCVTPLLEVRQLFGTGAVMPCRLVGCWGLFTVPLQDECQVARTPSHCMHLHAPRHAVLRTLQTDHLAVAVRKQLTTTLLCLPLLPCLPTPVHHQQQRICL